MAGMDWLEWHRDYEDPASSHSQRLAVVRTRIDEALDGLDVRARRVLSLCAGDGRDLLPVLATRPGVTPEVLLVELEPSLARAAADNAAGLGLEEVLVAEADAGETAVFADVLPVDLLLLCGIFGNVSDEDIQGTLAALPAMVSPGGYVIWTRGRFTGNDLRPTVRQWVVEAGFEELAYDGDPAPYGVGLARRVADDPPTRVSLPNRLFTFVR